MTTEPRWSLMKRKVLREHATGKEYLNRLIIFRTPVCSLYLHRMEVPDPGRHLHNHPWWFASLILKGGYTEEVSHFKHASRRAAIASFVEYFCPDSPVAAFGYGTKRSWKAGSIHTIPLHFCHRITKLHKTPTWTLVLCGPRVRSWGFYTPTGFVMHNEYDHPSLKVEV